MCRPVRCGMVMVQLVNVVGFWFVNVLMWTRSDQLNGRLGVQPWRVM